VPDEHVAFLCVEVMGFDSVALDQFADTGLVLRVVGSVAFVSELFFVMPTSLLNTYGRRWLPG